MIKFTVIFLFSMIPFVLCAQNIEGRWEGDLKIQGVSLRLVFNVKKHEDGYRSTMDSPDQGAKDIPVHLTTFEDEKIVFELPIAQIRYTGKLIKNEFVGIFVQRGQEFPLTLAYNSSTDRIYKRYQTPSDPFGYSVEEIKFENREHHINLEGTLTLPKGTGLKKFPVVILISGSGPQNRDYEIYGHKPFLVISDYLTNKGFGVLRFDDRGVGYSEGNFENSTIFDFVKDVESAIDYLKSRNDIDKENIGLIGHSEGGLVGSIVASKQKDVKFLVLLATPGLIGKDVIIQQQEVILRKSGIAENQLNELRRINSKLFDVVQNSPFESEIEIKNKLMTILSELIKIDSINLTNGMSESDFIDYQLSVLLNPWFKSFLKFDPSTFFYKVSCPVLAVFGSHDLQMLPKENLNSIENALKSGGNDKFESMIFVGLNHLFQTSETGLPNEYSSIEETFSQSVLEYLYNWLLKQS